MKQLLIFLLLCSLGFSQQIVQTETHEDGYIEVINYYKKKRSSSGTYKLIKVKSERYHENGQLRSEVTYKNGILDGLYKSYYEYGGQPRIKTTLKDGKKHGPWKWYYDNGQLKEEGTFKDDKRDGPIKEYHENGQLVGEGTYKDKKVYEYN